MTGLLRDPQATTVIEQRRRDALRTAAVHAIVVGSALLAATLAWRRPWQLYIGLGLGLILLVAIAWLVRPRMALGAVVFFALVGDIVTVYWFPFNKNLSSAESILFLHGAAFASPLEILLGAGIVALLLRRWFVGEQHSIGPLRGPLALLVGFIAFGFVRGVTTGGDLRVAMFEMRPLLTIPLVYVLATAFCDRPAHFRRLAWIAVAGVLTQALLSLHYYRNLPPAVGESLDRLGEHGSSITANLVIIVFLTALVYRDISRSTRWTLFLAAIPVTAMYLLAQRRAAVVALVAAILLLGITLFWNRRRLFWTVCPIVAILAIGYVGAFWNSESTVGFPAQAIKTVVAPETRDERDESSDIYRIIENVNLNATIRAAPVLGLGFGQPFLRPLPLPDISFFEFHEYLPHNSFLWVWIKVGFGGFVTLIYVLGRAIMSGVDRLRQQRDGPDAVVTAAAIFFIVMYTIYSYVDIGWDVRNNVMLGVALAICCPAFATGNVRWDSTVAARVDGRQHVSQPVRPAVVTG